MLLSCLSGATPSIRYSDHAPATSMVNIASESHPPILAIQGYSGTLVSLMRRTPQVESAGGDGSGSGPGSVPSPTSGSGLGLDLVLNLVLNLVLVLNLNLQPKSELPHHPRFLQGSRNKFGGFFKTIQRSTQRLTKPLDVVSGYQKLLVLLEPYLGDDAKGKRAAELLSEAKELITSFTDTQQRRYNAIMEMLRRLPKDYRGDQSASNKPSVMQKVKTLFGKKSPQ
ncbi:hypothetical protein BASA60_003050 [Batrachochytrium salamandrivorans]|nr:hypothetical protein BASA60_003050 [Batrachochytrium salamandrivorans]